MPPESRRAWYRIVYPLTERPTLEIGRTLHDVIDCSERGVRYEINHQRVPQVGNPVAGVLHLSRGENVQIEGVVLRVARGVVAVGLNPPLAFAQVMAEQRYLRSKGFLLRTEGQ